jgi:hypothetical protein
MASACLAPVRSPRRHLVSTSGIAKIPAVLARPTVLLRWSERLQVSCDVDGRFALVPLGVTSADDEHRAVEPVDESGVDRPEQAAQGRLMSSAAHHDG